VTDDGRGQLLPPVGWLARLFAWLRARPMLVLIGTLFAGLGVATARTRYYRTKAGRAQKAADIAAGKASRVESQIREADARKGVHTADAATEQARQRDIDAGLVVRDAGEDLEAISKRWPPRKNPLVKVLLAGAMAWSVAHGGDCPPAVDLSGLTSHLADMSDRLTGLDADAARDAVAALEAYQRQRDGLCAQLDARADLVAALEAGRTERDRLIETLTADRDAGWKAWEAEVSRRSVAPSLGRFGFTVGAGACVDADGQVTLCGAGVFGWRF